MKKIFLIFIILLNTISFAQDKTYTEQNVSINKFIDGSLLIPNNYSNSTLTIIISDSGPTDRNGNQNFTKSYNLKKLAISLAEKNIASYRYDKRIVKQIRYGRVDNNIMFDDFITDANSVIDYFKSKNIFNKIYIIGHGQGSLVGMVAAKGKADGFISLAGAGKSIDNVIIDQIELTAAIYTEDAKRVFKELKQGKTTDDYPEGLASIFSKDLQPFISNWMQYNPQEEINQLQIPKLIISGTKDLQVSVEEATLLNDASKNSTLKIIDKMNHILVPIEGDDLENSKSYNESYRKLSPEVVKFIASFIK